MSYRDSDYASSADLKAYLGITDTVDDAQIALAVTAASRAIDRACGRSFGVDSAVATREYRRFARQGWPSFSPFQRPSLTPLSVADISSTTGLIVEAADGHDFSPSYTTLTIDDDFKLLPLNADADGRPWTHIAFNPDSVTHSALAVKVTALFGWSAVPVTVKEATLIQASRFLKRRDAPFGVAGSPDLGSELRLLAKVDPDVDVMLGDYKRRWAAV
jgi:hypothetical protein